MRRFATFVFVAAVCAVMTPVFAVAHQCIHDRLIEMQSRDTQKGPVMEGVKARAARHGFRAQSPQGVRFAFGYEDLNDATRYCTQAGQVVDDKSGGTVTCTADDILTSDKRDILVNNILPAAASRLSAALLVEPVASNIMVPQDACSGFKVPAAHTSTGVPFADYVVYIGAAPTSGATLAWAAGCRTDTDGRLVVGRANFGPANINWDNSSTRADVVNTATHELLHALGFSGGSFGGHTRTTTLRDKSVTLLEFPELAAAFREFLGCASTTAITGVEIEDEGGGGSAGSHFERRAVMDDIMTAAGGTKLSALTLAAMEGLGHYTADYSKAELMTFGKHAGCEFITAKCNTEAGGRGPWWCFDTSSSSDSCTHDALAVGRCAVSQYGSALPTAFQYFSDPTVGGPVFLDGCPFVQGFTNRACNVPAQGDPIFGNYFGDGGRCFETTGLLASNYEVTGGGTTRCLKAGCSIDGFVQISVNGGRWEYCTSDIQQLFGFPGYDGAIVCPKRSEFCAMYYDTPALSPGSATYAPTPEPTIEPNLEPLPSLPDTKGRDTVLTTRAKLTWSGSQWGAALAEHKPDVVSEGVRVSIALLFGIGTVQLDIASISVGSLVVEYKVDLKNTLQEVDAVFQTAISTPANREWMKPMLRYYSGDDAPALKSHEIDKTTLVCQAVNLDEGTCYVVFGGVAVAVVILIVMLIWCCCCKSKKQKAIEEEEARRQELGAQAIAVSPNGQVRNNDPFDVPQNAARRTAWEPTRQQSAGSQGQSASPNGTRSSRSAQKNTARA
jgi:leishmanolysin